MGLAEWFSSFCDAIQVQDSGTISNRYKAITRRLNSDFWTTGSDTAHSLYVGSYGRNTAVRGFSDLDMLFQLPYSVYQQYNGYSGNGQSALLQAVKTSIERTYATTNIRGDGQVVQIPFDDKVTFEVLPTFVNENGSFTFPDANAGGQWRTTDPRAEMDAFRLRNSSCNQNLVALCRMMRAWRNEWVVPVGGILIDTLAYQFIENYEFREKSFLCYDFLSRDFFYWMSKQDSEQDYWKAPGSGQRVYGKGLFQYKADRCYRLSSDAIAYETASPKQESAAKQIWKDIFGSAFPH